MRTVRKKNSYNKWRSRRWIVTVWAMLLVSVICILGIVFREPAYVTVATTLVAIPVAFTSLETLNKKWKHGAEAGAENGNG